MLEWAGAEPDSRLVPQSFGRGCPRRPKAGSKTIRNAHQVPVSLPLAESTVARRAPFSLKGKSALVTGGGSGIGAAITRLFLERGAQVTVCGRRQHRLEALRKSVRRSQARLHLIRGDIVTDAETIVSRALSHMKSMDILVNNAATSAGKPLEELDMDDWFSVQNTNLAAAFRMTRLCVPHLKATKGCVLNISSVSVVSGEYDDVAYAASKAGLEGLSRQMAVELAAEGVRSNVIRPGLIDTEAFADQPPEFFETMIPLIPMGRLGKPEDVAYASLYLCSQEAKFVTGAVLAVDGGEANV